MVAASALHCGLHRKVSAIMVSKRLKSDARAHMKAHPGISYQEALRAVTGDGAEPGMEYSTNDLIDLLAVFGITESDAEDLPRVWERNSGTATLRAPYAHDVDGDGQLTLDLCEKNLGGDGAHAAVIGPTGCGKSTLLRSLVLGLALLYGPDKVSLVLGDFKGRNTFHAMDKLPHVMSVISNLENDQEAQHRLTDFIAEEVDRREALILSQPDCKGVHEYRRRHHRDPDCAPTPLPYMVVVLDELSEWGASFQLRRALEQLGRVGRVLGIHLVLSSQRLDRDTLGRLCEQLESVLHLQSPPQQQVLVAEESASILVEHLSRYRA